MAGCRGSRDDICGRRAGLNRPLIFLELIIVYIGFYLRVFALAALTLLVACSQSSDATLTQRLNPVGYAERDFLDTVRERPLSVRIWYPAAVSAQQGVLSYGFMSRGYAAKGAEYLGGDARPLLLLSHGDRGDSANQAWLAEALAGSGFIVAAVDHWHNSSTDAVAEETVRVWHRPADISFVLTELLRDPAWGARIDRRRIGAAGHSSGGYTVLALAGAIYRADLMRAYCASSPRPPDCQLADKADFSKIDFSQASADYRDDRISAVFAMAPAVGPALAADSLRAIAIPVHIVASLDDEVLPYAFHAGRDQQLIPGATMTALPAAGHFVYLPECPRLAAWFIDLMQPFDLCGRARPDVDRHAVHRAVAEQAEQFFAAAWR